MSSKQLSRIDEIERHKAWKRDVKRKALQTPDDRLPCEYSDSRYHSDMLEALAIGHAIHCIPRDNEAAILTDSMMSASWWQHYIAVVNKIWKLVTVRVHERTQPVTIERVKAHVDIFGNELADKLAKAAEEATSSSLPV
ncbi:hypothetical protein THASP1DRAFT_21582 [Thamnocephalis sphaerospora]|uniref:RNase H type-1 domain-containing protein n=1 Tax=Thamnocephalis sphaerospora TaxID=78915 RepID=A0A4P9XWL1_9FUNG|nr:hypothetical protein THASP1DRAFT_21582 [Thamnocephalis sphaerospora]|eukprot:RKP10763.1 hypothetical protein THASP1DRAFT_21582 [Thamnocephalis sphaerospora]